MSSASTSLFDVVAITAVAVVVAVILLVVLMRRAAAYPYRAVDFLLSPAEAELLAALRQGLGGDYEVYPKVRLADLVDVRKGLTRKQRAEALAHIESRHVAFVVCDRETSAIRGVVEPEPATTRRPGRHRRAPFLDAALHAAHVPLVRVPAQSAHSPADLRDRVLAALAPASGTVAAESGKLGYFGPAAHALPGDADTYAGGRWRAARAGRERDDGPGSAATWLPTRGVLAVAAVLLILAAILSWFVEPRAPATPATAPAVSAVAPPPATPVPAPAAAAPPSDVVPAPDKPREIVGYRDVRVPGKPLAECMGPDREIGPEVLRCRDGYTRREPIYR